MLKCSTMLDTWGLFTVHGLVVAVSHCWLRVCVSVCAKRFIAHMCNMALVRRLTLSMSHPVQQEVLAAPVSSACWPQVTLCSSLHLYSTSLLTARFLHPLEVESVSLHCIDLAKYPCVERCHFWNMCQRCRITPRTCCSKLEINHPFGSRYKIKALSCKATYGRSLARGKLPCHPKKRNPSFKILKNK